MNIWNYLKRPEYVWRPRQVIRRLRRAWAPPEPLEDVTLPWGTTVRVHIGENIGQDIYLYGIFDKIVPETIWRLLDPGESAVEVGANIGQNVSLMASLVGSTGRVIAFEAHPEVYAELVANSKRWGPELTENLFLFNIAVGKEAGTAVIQTDDEFLTNRGSASLRGVGPDEKNEPQIHVAPLDNYIEGWPKIGVCKIDVEGHELEVLEGAQNAIREKRIRDVIFEDFREKPSPVTEFLSRHGFTIFELHATWLKPRLEPVRNESGSRKGFTFNFLATLDPRRSITRFQGLGWRCLMSL